MKGRGLISRFMKGSDCINISPEFPHDRRRRLFQIREKIILNTSDSQGNEFREISSSPVCLKGTKSLPLPSHPLPHPPHTRTHSHTQAYLPWKSTHINVVEVAYSIVLKRLSDWDSWTQTWRPRIYCWRRCGVSYLPYAIPICEVSGTLLKSPTYEISRVMFRSDVW